MKSNTLNKILNDSGIQQKYTLNVKEAHQNMQVK